MALSVEKTICGREYKVKDMSQATVGRDEIEFAEGKMPGLMACRSELGSQPFKGARITGCLPMISGTGVFIKTLIILGAEVRWCSSNRVPTQDHAAAAISSDSAAVFAWNGETLQEHWWCVQQALDWGPGGGPDLIVDDGGAAVKLIQEGVKAEKVYEKTGKLPDPASTDDAEFQILLTIIRDGLKTDPKRYHKMKGRLVGVSEETTTGVKRLYQMQANGTLSFSAINVGDSITKSKFDKSYGCRHSLPDSLTVATSFKIADKLAVVCGYGDVGKDCAAALKQAGVRVVVTEINCFRAIQAHQEGYCILTLDDVVSKADIFVTTTGSEGIIMVHHMKEMKNNAIVCNMSHCDREISILELEQFPGVKHISIRSQTDKWPQTDKWLFPSTKSGIIVLAEGRRLSLGCATAPREFMVMSCSFTNHLIAQLELWETAATSKYKEEVYFLPKHLDEKVAALHLGEIGAKLTAVAKNTGNFLGRIWEAAGHPAVSSICLRGRM
ncbi:hypothetical protein BT93_H1702 [Corymbia citriodora subsp. variegata]|nr:hypothetical protein BT93_H1702 [Corymbia citriodora subsp. variegata]